MLNPWIFAGAAVFSLITVYLSCIRPCRIASKVSPIEAIRYTEGQQAAGKKKSKKTRKVSPRTMAFQNIQRNKKKVAVVVASLSLALILLSSIYSLVQGFDMDKFVSSMTVSDFSVADATLDNFSVDYNAIVTDGVTERFMDALKARKGVKEIGNLYLKEINPVFTDEMYAVLDKRILQNPEVQKNFEQIMREEGISLQEYAKAGYIDGKIYGIGKLVMEKLENPKGTLDWEKFSTGNYVITVRCQLGEESDINYFEPGETVTVSNESGETREYKVLAVADMPYSCGIQHFGMFDCNFILPEEEYLDFMGEQQPMRTIFNVEKSQEERMENWLADYCENIEPDLTYTSKASIVKEFDSQKNMYSMVGGLLALIMAMIGILNFINTMVTSVLTRKQEFAMMEAVGMTGSQLKQMLCFEGGYYALFTLLCSVAGSIILSATAVRSLGGTFFFFTWRLTISPIFACLPAIIVVVLLVPIICYRNMSRSSVVERMRKAE